MSLNELYPHLDGDLKIIARREVSADTIRAGSLNVSPDTGDVTYETVTSPVQRTYADLMTLSAQASADERAGRPWST